MDPDYNKFPLIEAIKGNSIDTVKSLLDAKSGLAVVKDADGRFPIHWAVLCNDLPNNNLPNDLLIVKELAGQNNFDPDVQDGSGWTPLMIAASLKDDVGDKIIKLLLEKGADVNVKSSTGQNALHFAASKINTSTVKTLIANKCSARVKDRVGQLPLHRAAAVGSVQIMENLLKEGKSPLNATDMDGLTALHHAIAEGHGHAAIFLLKVGAEADKRNSSGQLAIDMAPDAKVRQYILQTAENEGIELP